jgi:hypothetical protein
MVQTAIEENFTETLKANDRDAKYINVGKDGLNLYLRRKDLEILSKIFYNTIV